MDKNSGFFGGFGGRGDPALNIPVTGSVSPYMNFDPSLVAPTPESQFIIPEGQGPQRGHLEKAFGFIGYAVLGGGIFGGATGVFKARDGLFAGKIARTKMLNIIGKQGASAAQMWGSAALLYSLIGWGATFARGVDDEMNHIFSGAAAGTIFYCTGGVRRAAMGGAGGTLVAAVYCYVSNEHIRHKLGMSWY